MADVVKGCRSRPVVLKKLMGFYPNLYMSVFLCVSPECTGNVISLYKIETLDTHFIIIFLNKRIDVV